MPIRKCFRRSMAFFAWHNILIFVETMLFSIPIFVFRNDQETNIWSEYFIWIVGLQVKLLIANVIVIPPLLGGLAYIYFVVKGHPWARILKRELLEKNLTSHSKCGHKNLIKVASQDLTSSGTRSKSKSLTRSQSNYI